MTHFYKVREIAEHIRGAVICKQAKQMKFHEVQVLSNTKELEVSIIICVLEYVINNYKIKN